MDELILRRNINNIITQISMKEIKNDEELKITGEWLKRIKETEKMVNAYFDPKREELYKPYKVMLDKIKDVRAPLLKIESVIKKMRLKYKQEQNEKLLKQKQEMVRLADTDEEKQEMEKKNETKVEDVSGISDVISYGYDVIDFAMVPDKYKILNDKLVAKIVKAMGEKTDIPGIKPKKIFTERVRV